MIVKWHKIQTDAVFLVIIIYCESDEKCVHRKDLTKKFNL